MIFGSPCTIFRDPEKNKFEQRCQRVFTVGIVESIKDYHIYITKERSVVT